MNRSEKYWEKASELFELCQDQPEGQWEETLKKYGESDPGIREDIRKLLHNKDVAGIYFDSFRDRIETELSSRTSQYEFKEGDQTKKFRILKILFKSNNTEIYLAYGRGARINHKRIAVKVIKAPSSINKLKSKLNKERKILARLNHPNIAEFYAEGMTSKGMPYILMEYIDGVPVDIFCEKNQLALNARIRLFIKVCNAVQYLHNSFVIHNDIKPGNILVTARGQIKFIDFGISEIINKGENNSSPKKSFAGTISYASPEQLKGSPTTPSSDIYQMGVVLYKLITGEHPSPFMYNKKNKYISTGLSLFTNLLREKYKEHFPLAVRKNFCGILGKAMAENPANRYASANAFKNELKNLLIIHRQKQKSRNS